MLADFTGRDTLLISSALTSQPFNTRWVNLRRATSLHAPYQWRPWLTNRDSLTQHLIRASQGKFRVELISQKWQMPSLSEAKALGIDIRQQAVVREVRLMGNDQAWVYARSVIPASTLTGKERQLHHIGNRSLGTILFTDTSMRRGPLEICRLDLPQQSNVWGRRSVFYLSGKPLLVTEVFLPELEHVNYQP